MTEKVVCIDDTPPWFGWYGDALVKGNVYTIKSSYYDDGNGDSGNDIGKGYILHEASTDSTYTDDYHLSGEIGYRASRFAPVKDTNIEIFREIDRKIFDGETVDA
jgi:hypothetical protein